MEKQTPPREQIVMAAIKLLSQGGTAALTTKNLADAVGVSEPALYRHFDSKLDILVAILDRFEAQLGDLFEEALKQEVGAQDRIQAVYTRVFRNFAAQPALASVVFAEEIFRHDKRLSERVARITDMVEDRILGLIRSRQGRVECRNDVPPKDLARIVMGSLRFLVTRWRLSGCAFDLQKEGMAFWRSVRTLISTPIT